MFIYTITGIAEMWHKLYKDAFTIKHEMTQKFNVIIEKGEDGYLISNVVELPGCHTQAKTLDELMRRTKEAISLYLSVKKSEKALTTFLGLQQVEIEA